MRSKLGKIPCISIGNLVQNRYMTFKHIDWGLHYYPKIIKNKSIIGFHAPIVNLGDKKDKSKTCLMTLKNIIDEIKGYNYLTIHLHNGKEPDKDTLINNLSEISDYAKKNNIKLCIENLRKGFSSNPNNVIEMVDICNCNITFDIGHTDYKYRDEFIDIFSNRIYNVHVYELEKDKIGHIAPNNLDNLRSVLDKLLDNKCDFWLIELMKLNEIIYTKNLLEDYLDNHK
nr:TIM barrel protein [Methanothermococcus okinawensis]